MNRDDGVDGVGPLAWRGLLARAAVVGAVASACGATAGAQEPLLDGGVEIRLPGGLKIPAEKPCLEPPDGSKLSEDEMISELGLTIDDIQTAVDRFLPKIAECVRDGTAPFEAAWFDMVVGCNGRVTSVDVVESGDWPLELVACVRATMRYIPFPAHGLPDGEMFQQPIGFVSGDKPVPAPPPAEPRAPTLSTTSWDDVFGPRTSDEGSGVGVTEVVVSRPKPSTTDTISTRQPPPTPPKPASTPAVVTKPAPAVEPAVSVDVVVGSPPPTSTGPIEPTLVEAPAQEQVEVGGEDAIAAVEPVEPVEPQLVEGVARPADEADVGAVGPGEAEDPTAGGVVAAVEVEVEPAPAPAVDPPKKGRGRGRRGEAVAAVVEPAAAAVAPVIEPVAEEVVAVVEPAPEPSEQAPVAAIEPERVEPVQAPVEPVQAPVAPVEPVMEQVAAVEPSADVVEPAVVEPVEPAVVEPVEPAVAEPAVVEPAVAEPAAVEPAEPARFTAVAQRVRRILKKDRAIFPEPLVLLHGDDALRCDARVEVDAKGRAGRVSFTDCPDGLHLAARDALAGWRWEALDKDAPVEVQPARVAFVRLERPYYPGATYLLDPDVLLGDLAAPVLLKSGAMPVYPVNVQHGDFTCLVSAVISRNGSTRLVLVDECPEPFRIETSKAVKRWTWFLSEAEEQDVEFRVRFQLTHAPRQALVQ
jgi:hypothetical protein